MFVHSRSINSLDSWLSGVAKIRELNGLAPLQRDVLFKEHKKGLKAIFGPVDTKAPAPPLDEGDLRKLRTSLNLGDYEQARFWFCALAGFQALLRAGEISAGRLRFSDIAITKEGLRITVLFSKAKMSPVSLALVAREDALCPVRAFVNLKARAPAGDKIYPGSYNAFNSELKRRFAFAGVVKTGLASHSLRRGGATALFMAEVPTLSIMAHGRWSSDVWRQYVEIGYAQQLLPSRLLRNAQRLENDAR
jgi:hypothetical protein